MDLNEQIQELKDKVEKLDGIVEELIRLNIEQSQEIKILKEKICGLENPIRRFGGI